MDNIIIKEATPEDALARIEYSKKDRIGNR